MFGKKYAIKLVVISIFILVVIGFIGTPLAQAQYWQALPPYNLLWPLWSPVLSPLDSFGTPIPLLSQLTNTSILPVQPVLAWDPSQALPWALYNIPPVLGGGLSYFSPFYGLNPFPPPYLLDPLTQLPAPLTLPVGFGALSPTSVTSGIDIITLGNIQYLLEYPTGLFGIPQSSLLTVADIWGLPAI